MEAYSHPTPFNQRLAGPPRLYLESGAERMVGLAATPNSLTGFLAHIVGFADNGAPVRGACTGTPDCPGCLAGLDLVRCVYATVSDVRDLRRTIFTVDLPAERDACTAEILLRPTNSQRVRDFVDLISPESPANVCRMAVVRRDAGAGKRIHLRGLSHDPAQFFPAGFIDELFVLTDTCRDHVASNILKLLPAREYGQHEHIRRLISHAELLRESL